MTESGAKRIVALAAEAFGEQVQAMVTRRPGPGVVTYATMLYHKRLGRQVSVSHVDDWPFVRDCWQAATREEKPKKKMIYRWAEPGSVSFDAHGKRVQSPASQEEGEYVGEAPLRGYVAVMWNGKKHLVNRRDVVSIREMD